MNSTLIHPLAVMLCALPSLVAADETRVRTFLRQHCDKCHGSEQQEAGLRLDQLAWKLDDRSLAKPWIAVLDRVTAGEMPPAAEPQPAASERKAVADALQISLHNGDLARQQREGRTVYRRLNRFEYENTVRDLLAVDVKLADLLPEDTLASGFDNIGEALTVSSVLVERYLEAADAALDAALVQGPRPATQRVKVTLVRHPDDYRLKLACRLLPDQTVILFNARDSLHVLEKFRAPVAGLYRLRISAYAYQTAGQPSVMSIHSGSFEPNVANEALVGYFDLPPDQPQVIEVVARLPAQGTIKPLPYRVGDRNLPDWSKYAGPGVAIQWVEIEGPLIDQWPPASYQRLLGDVDLKAGTLDDAQRILRSFVPRAFRRPVPDEEIVPLVDLVRVSLSNGHTFEEALRVGLKAVLCAPEFLFLIEKPGRLDPHALASRLSYFLWSAPPDEKLLAVAQQGTLAEPVVIREQVERMLRDPKSQAFTTNFTGQWLDLRKIDFTQPDKTLYPEFDPLLQKSMVEETQAFFQELLTHDLSVSNVVHSDFAMLNERLSEHYGIAGVTGLKIRKTPLPAGSHRGGVLTQASVLKVTANGTTTSPVVRGAWVLDRILGRPAPPPPKNVAAVEPDTRGTKTIREQLAAHRNARECNTCHAKIDPPGFVLENFDVIGTWRTNYRTLGPGVDVPLAIEGRKVQYRVGPAVDASAELLDGHRCADIDEFKQALLADREQIARCVAEKLLIYATGHRLEFADRRAVTTLLERAKASDYGLRTLVHEVVQSETFLRK
ncbi:MAG: hypothetical protein JWN70_5681 [Planctomycetaceae bacterium]|nr:hypothetical protein [Planctomycetaceae bacterium]